MNMYKALAEVEKLEQEKKDLIQTLDREELRYQQLELENGKMRAALVFIKDKAGTWEKAIELCEKALKS